MLLFFSIFISDLEKGMANFADDTKLLRMAVQIMAE